MQDDGRAGVPHWFTAQLAFLATRARTVILESGYHTPMLFSVGGARGPVDIIALVPWGPEHRPRWRAVCESLVGTGHAVALFHISEAWMGEGPEAVAYREQHSLASYAGRVEMLMVQGVCRQGQASRLWQLVREQPQDDTSCLLDVVAMTSGSVRIASTPKRAQT
jgi:hypothetical protein